jgi:endonuclease/exonuclease/phosphatase family metal-dependent hydrolase
LGGPLAISFSPCFGREQATSVPLTIADAFAVRQRAHALLDRVTTMHGPAAGRSGSFSHVTSTLALAGALLVLALGAQRWLGDPALTRRFASVIDRGGDQHRVWRTRSECERVLAQGDRLPRQPGSVRLASWNIRWFPDSTRDPGDGPERGTNVEWLSCALAWLDADVIAVQEFRTHERGRALARELIERLNAHTQGSWQLDLDACRGGDDESHVGFLYDGTRATASRVQPLETLIPEWGCNGEFERAFTRYFRFPGGLDLHLVALHVQWGTEQRQIARRRRAHDRIGETWAALQKVVPDPDVVFLGDFNTSGCDDCYPTLSSTGEVAELADKLSRRNPRFRLLDSRPQCTEYYDNVATAIDHMAVHAGMAEVPERASVEVYGGCRALKCRPLNHNDHFSAFFEQLSDHCPIVLTIADRDLD